MAPFDDTLDKLAVRAIDGLTDHLVNSFIVDVRLWDVPGRVIHYTHQSPDDRLRVRACDFLTIQNGLALQVTTTCAVSDWPAFSEIFEQIARSTTAME
ncbi:MAG: hypothetical protein L0J58_04190, partial [Micrococcaceae bacterium]|nr:hypothetical protein [Micrococcaceae bacterium]